MNSIHNVGESKMHEVEVSILGTMTEYMYNLVMKIGSGPKIYEPLPLEKVTARALYRRELVYLVDGNKYEYKYFNHKKLVSCVECYQLTKMGRTVYDMIMEAETPEYKKSKQEYFDQWDKTV